MINVGILMCDGKERLRFKKIIEDYLSGQKYNYAISEFADVDQLYSGQTKLDILFVGIDETNAGLQGIENITTLIIFMTDNRIEDIFPRELEYGVLVKKDAVIMYLPIIFRRLFMYMKTMVRERILLNMKGRQLVVYVSDIMYMERDKRMTKVICKDETLTTAADLTALVNQIGRHDVIRCHNSYVINFRYVREFRRNEFVLTDGPVIPVSRRYLDETRNEFSIWIAK